MTSPRDHFAIVQGRLGKICAGATSRLHLADLATGIDRYNAAREALARAGEIQPRDVEEVRSYAVEILEAARHCGLLAVLRSRLAQAGAREGSNIGIECGPQDEETQ